MPLSGRGVDVTTFPSNNSKTSFIMRGGLYLVLDPGRDFLTLSVDAKVPAFVFDVRFSIDFDVKRS